MSRDATRWAGRPPKITPAQYQELQRWKAARDALPSLRELAAQIGVPFSTARKTVEQGIKRYEVA